MKIKAYLDEDVPVSFAQGLKNRGVDVITTHDAGNEGLDDIAQLNYASKLARVFFTHNKGDFAKIHKRFITEGKTHYGIILSDQLPVGDLLRRFMKVWFRLSAEEMRNKLEFLSNWK